MPSLDFPLFHILLMLFGIYPAVNCVWSWRTSQTCWTISLNYFYIFRSAFWGPPTYVWFSWDIKMVPHSYFYLLLNNKVWWPSLGGKLYFLCSFAVLSYLCLLLHSICVNKIPFSGVKHLKDISHMNFTSEFHLHWFSY